MLPEGAQYSLPRGWLPEGEGEGEAEGRGGEDDWKRLGVKGTHVQ